MSQAPNRKCKVCARPYYACDPCIESRGQHWKYHCCSTTCFKAYVLDVEKYDKNKQSLD